MKIHKHAAVSTVISALVLVSFGRAEMSVASFLAGILTDLDHIFDYYMNHEIRCLSRLLRRLPYLCEDGMSPCKVYKPLHSIELLIAVLLPYTFITWNGVAAGILIGFSAHLIMDFLQLGHIGAISMIYKIAKGFPCGEDIVKQKLLRLGKDPKLCQRCGAYGETVISRPRPSHVGPAWGDMSRITVLCPICRDRM